VIADLPPLVNGIVMMPGLMLLVGAVVAGGSMVGAEWQAGSLITLLTWEPRRSRLLAARMIAAALVGFAIALALLSLFTLLVWITAATKGELPDGTDWWVTYGGVVLRLSGFTGLAAVVGAALAMIGKRTALAVLAIPVYLIGAELVLRWRWEAARPWLVMRNFVLAVGGEEHLPDAGSAPRGVAVMLVWSAAVVALAFVAFNRRDFATSS
jgi:ABC-type transport system involved in multi-copper enzyme maturation permease subunit